MKVVEPRRERRLFELHGDETLVPGMQYDPACDAFAAVISAGRYVGPFRVESSLGASAWLRGVSRLTLSANGAALAYVEDHEDGCFVVGPSQWGPYHWIAAGPQFDAEGVSLAWIEDLAGGGQAHWVDGVERARAAAGSWDPHEGSPLSLPLAARRPDASASMASVITPLLRSGHWQAQIGENMTAPVQWMSDAITMDGNLVGFLVRDGVGVCWRAYDAGDPAKS